MTKITKKEIEAIRAIVDNLPIVDDHEALQSVEDKANEAAEKERPTEKDEQIAELASLVDDFRSAMEEALEAGNALLDAMESL
jgi:cell fate (sporulation/competence/biofilm development) regulator YmcA (YheA/YmcA/DUF963 family)